MSNPSRKHLTKEQREVIEAGLLNNDSARTIAKRLRVSPSTITREVKTNRTLREKKSNKPTKLSHRCVHVSECDKVGSACSSCFSSFTLCKQCRTKQCIYYCSDFMRKVCPQTQKWPYICPVNCKKRSGCNYQKASYSAYEADQNYRNRLSSTRSGIAVTQEELVAMDKLITPLIKQGQSYEAIWREHSSELPIGLRSAYNYQEKGLFSTPNIELPRKVRYKLRKKSVAKREHIDRSAHEYKDFQALSVHEIARVVQADSVQGFQENNYDLLSLMLVARSFQFYFKKKHGTPDGVVGIFDMLERYLDSREAFKRIFEVILADRGSEFNNFEGMERSYLEPDKKRCRVYFCDPMKSNQKAQCERNHEQLRRILPKGRSDFDTLSAWDCATITSHINSYPSPKQAGARPIDLIQGLVPQELLDLLGIERIAPDDVTLKPKLVNHAVIL